MAALDFPLNPSAGQQYTLNGVNYYYDSVVGAWLTSVVGNPIITSVATVSGTTPATANVGDIWFNTSLSKLFVYYDDGSSSQWVEPSYAAVFPDQLKVNTSFTVANAAFGVANGGYTVANAAFARGNTSAQLAFFRVAANGSNLDAVSNADTLTIGSSNNIVLIANSTNDSIQITQAPSGVTAATYGGSSNVSSFAVDAFGRITAAANVAISSASLLRVTQYTSSTTWTKGAGTKYVLVYVVGGGGGGATSGGGAGGTAIGFLDVSAVSSVSVTVGSLGSGGDASTTGGTGGNSSFGTYYYGFGGSGGGASNDNGGSGGGASGGFTNISGQSGSIRMGTNSAGSPAGFGGNSLFGFGGFPLVNGTPTATGHGAGGGGRALAGTAGSGTGGLVIVYEFA